MLILYALRKRSLPTFLCIWHHDAAEMYLFCKAILYIAFWRRVYNGVTELIDDEIVGMGEFAKPFEFSTTNSSPLTFCHPLLACSFAIIRTSRMWVITSPLKRWSLNGVTDTDSGLAFAAKFCTVSRKAGLIRSCYCQSSNTIDGSLNNVANQY